MNLKKMTSVAFVAASILASSYTVYADPELDVYSSSISITEDCSDAVIAKAKEEFAAAEGDISETTLTLNNVSVEQALKAIKEFSGVNSLVLDEIPFKDLSFIKELPNLTTLRITLDKKYEPLDISALEGNDKLTDISFHASNIVDLAPLSGCSNLEKLIFYSCDIKSNTISPLGKLAKLEELDLYGTNIDDFSSLASLENLKEINVYATTPNKGSTLDYNKLSTIKSLEKIKAGLTKMTSVAFLSELPEIKAIEFLGEEIKDLETLENCESLEEIMFWSHRFTLDGNKIGKAKSLKKLKFWSTDSVSNFEGLGNLTNLEELYIDGIEKSNKADNAIDTAFIANMPELKELYIRGVEIKDLNKVPQSIEEISIESVNGSGKVIDLANLSAPELTKLEIKGDYKFNTKISNIAAIAKNLPKIKTLTLQKVDGIDSYDFLKDLPDKTRVTLSKGCKISEDLIKELKDKKKMTINLY